MLDFAKSLLATVHDGLVARRRVSVLSSLLANLIPENAMVLDVGTGNGLIAARIMGHRTDVVIEGVEVRPRTETCIPVKAFDGYHLPFADETFDCVMLVDVLHHTISPAMHLSEAARVSRRHLVIKDHLLEGLFAGQVLRFMDWFGNWGYEVPLPCNYLQRSQWQQMFGDTRLEVDLWIDRLGLYPAPTAW